MALHDVNAVVTITTNAVKAIDDGKKLKQIYADINEQLNKMRAEGKTDTSEFKQMQKLAEDTKAKINEMLRGMELIDKVMGDISGHIGKDLNRALRETSKEFNKTSSSTDDGKAKLERLRDVVADLKRELSDRRGLTMSLKDAEAQLKNLNNVSLDKLKQGLQAVQEEAAKTTSATTRERYQGYAKQYRAQIAVNELGRAGSGIDLSASSESLQKEAQRLRQGFMATEGVRGYESISNEYLSKLQAINDLLAKRAEKERQVAQEQKKNKEEIDRWNKAVDTWQRMANGQKVSVEELTEAYKTLELELKKMQGVNPDQAANIKNGMEQIKSVIDVLEGKQIDIDKIISDPNATLEQLDAALKKVQEDAAKIPAGFDWDIKKNTEDAEELKTKIAELKDKMQGIADIDYDNLEFVPTEKLEAALKSLEAQEKKLAGYQKSEAEQVAQKKKKVQDQINKNKQATMDFASAEKMAGETGKHSISDLQKAYDTLKQKLMGLKASEKGEIEKTRENMAKLKKTIDETTGSIAKQGGIWQTAVKNITAYVGVFGAFNFIKGKLTDVIRLNLELSDSMANIRKVSGLAMRDIQDLTRTLAKMDTRTTLAELEEISYRGAKLGFGNFGTQGLLEFAQAANVVNVALKEDLGDEALAALSKITENMGLIKKMGVEDAMLATGSAMFQLAASSTAAAGPIVEVTKRLVPVAQMSGFATHEILALASASDSLHLMPEVVGTALSKLIMALQNNHNLVEKYLGIDEGTIAQLFKAGDAMDALLLVFDKMNGKNVTELDDLWKLLGSDGQRLITVVADMANHTDTLRTHLETSTKAFMEATAVTDEYNIQQETAAALIERANNAWRNAFINPDAEKNVKGLAQAWYDFSKGLLDSELTMKGITLALNLLLGSLRLLLSLLPALTAFAIVKTFNKLRIAMMESKIATDMFATSWKNMTAATKANWIGLALGAFTQLVFWIKNAASESDELATSQKKLQDAMTSAQGKAEEEISSLERLKGQLENATLAEEDRAKILNKVKSDYDHYLNYLGIEINTVDELTRHYDALTKVMKQRFAYQEREDYKRENLQDIKQQRRTAGADLKRMGKDMGLNVDLSLVDQYVKSGTKNAGEAFMKMFPDVEKTIAARQKTGMGGGKYGDFSKQFAAYFSKVRTEVEQTKKIDDAFAEEIGDFDYDKYLRTQIKGDFKVKPDKGAEKEARKAAQERKKALKLEMDEAQKASTGIISKLEEYYRLQEAAIQEARADGELTEDQAKEMVRSLSILKNESLATARRAVTTGNTAEWDQLKKTILPAVMSDTSDVSRNLLSVIQQVAVEKLHTDLEKFNGSSDVLGLDSRAFFDQMRAKAAGNEREAARLRAKIQNEVEKALLQYQFVEKANQQMRKDLEAMGITTETYEQFAKRMQAGIMEKQPTITTSGREITDEQAYREMGNKFMDMGVINFRYNIDNEEEARQWVKQFATDARGDLEGWAQAFPQLSEWIDIIKRKEQGETLGEAEQKALEEAMPAIRNLFDEMMRHADRLNKAMKDAFQHEKEQQESRFRIAGYKDQEEQTDKVYSNQAKQQETGAGQNFVQMLGLGSIANDPEILQIQNRIRWRAMEVEDAQRQLDALKAQQDERIAKLRETAASEAEIHAMEQQHAQDRAGLEQLLMDRQTALTEQTTALTTQTMQELQKRSQAILKLSKPFTDAANSIGKKLGDMIRGAEEDSITWEEIWKNMALAVGEAMIEMGAQYLQNLIMQQSINRASEAEEAAHVATEVPMGIAAGSAKTIGQLGWWGIPLVAVISALLMGLLQAALSTNRNNNSANAAKPKVKLASGMLTYDKGNVQQTVGSQWRGKNGEYITDERRTVVGDDGRVYRAREQRSLPEGVSMVTEPIATRVNGQQALVGERGPEIVIGRRTTRAIQMNRPDLLRDLALIDRGITTRKVRTFDEGNLSDLASAIRPSDGATGTNDQQGSGQIDETTAEALRQLPAAMAAFAQVMSAIQRDGIPADVNMYSVGGRKGLYEKFLQADKFYKKYGG